MTRVFVVDDDPSTRRLLQLSLEGEGYEVQTASDGQEGLRRIQDELPDLVILDIVMPGLDGFGFVRQLRQDPRTAEVPIMILSSRAEVHDRVKALKLGADDYLTKPADLPEIIARVGTLLTLENVRLMGQGHVTVCIGVKGGAGTTTIAVNLAAALAKMDERTVVLMDACFQFGGVHTALNIRSPHSVADLLPYTAHLDSDLVSSVLAAHHSGLKVLLAPSGGGRLEMPEPTHPGPILKSLREMFDHVVVDAWPFLNPLTLAILDEAHAILLVLTPEVSSLHNARLWLRLAEERGYAPSRLHLVLNQDSGQKGFGQREITRLLDCPLFHTLPFEPWLARQALNRGVPLVLGARRDGLAKGLDRLAQQVRGLQSPIPGLTSQQDQGGLNGLVRTAAGRG
jgi:pilus assembly protein CpaE